LVADVSPPIIYHMPAAPVKDPLPMGPILKGLRLGNRRQFLRPGMSGK
jgi:hypothetical protein